MLNVKDIRHEFLNYFKNKGHEVVASSSLVPHNDPTLMFTNSGMVQFKNVFTGQETRPYTRATTSQKSVRAGGKHNDLDNVGYTARHHTFFEMLGNFSFGDYFKADAIPFAWELITKIYGLSPDKLCVTVYHDDDEAANIWKKVTGFHDSKIIRINTNDNFWAMGDTGPCGPCSEIFFDHGDHIFGGPPGSPDADGDRFVEIWNLVFMQFEQVDKETRVKLPKPSIDTGMGLERLAAILQGKHNNYDIDLLAAITGHVSDLTGQALSPSHRVIADHLRSSAFLLADGVMPSNEGRGYVLRRIMRRGMRHAHLLGANDPLLYKLFPTLLAQMGEAYPELKRAEPLIVETLKLEETRFKKTLERGLRLLDDESAKVKSGGLLQGDVAFKLYDTYGFPVDLTQDALRAKNINVDMDGFNTAMEKQKAEARKSWAGSGDVADGKIWFELLDKIGVSEFLGYAQTTAEAQIKAILKDGKSVDSATIGDTVMVLVNQTPFYAESGGQVADTGTITGEKSRGIVTDCQKKLGKLFAHNVTIENGNLRVGDAVQLTIDTKRRAATCAHHSATHLLHEALRQKLGEHIAQKGSLNGPDRLRFDFVQPTPISANDLTDVELAVNNCIRANTNVTTRIMDLDDAVATGARALFGEKYEGEVRVVSMGHFVPDLKRPYSIELCGGTHVQRTGDIGACKIIAESSVSAGIRRVEALVGQAALDYFNAQDSALQKLADTLKTSREELPVRIDALIEDKKRLERDIADLRRKLATGGNASGGDDFKLVNGVKFAGRVLNDMPAAELKPLADALKTKLGSGVIALVSVADGKASLVVAVTDDLTKRFSAVDLVKIGAAKLGGKGGGGRPDMAQAGGSDCNAANDALSSIESMLVA